jgi:hypothetical protein
LHDIGGILSTAQQVSHDFHTAIDVPDEGLVAGTQLVQAGFAIRRLPDDCGDIHAIMIRTRMLDVTRLPALHKICTGLEEQAASQNHPSARLVAVRTAPPVHIDPKKAWWRLRD